MAEFSRFDQRGYRTVAVREGYRSWQPSYETTVLDLMDLALLDRIDGVTWAGATVVDLGCGTGRAGRWLEGRRVTAIDGIDVTPEMLDRARQEGRYRRVLLADVRDTGLPSSSYDVAVCSLVDEHLPELGPLYDEAARLLVPAGTFVIVGYHPFFMMAGGVPTHFDDDDGRPTAIETHLHLLSDHVAAARGASLAVTGFWEQVLDDAWIAAKPRWERYRGWPISFAWVWRAAG